MVAPVFGWVGGQDAKPWSTGGTWAVGWVAVGSPAAGSPATRAAGSCARGSSAVGVRAVGVVARGRPVDCRGGRRPPAPGGRWGGRGRLDRLDGCRLRDL